MSTWQPIATAPKDGTPMLAVGNTFNDPAKGRHFAVVVWNQDECAFLEAGDEYALDPYSYLTHWMPLPAPPEAE